MNLWVFQIQIKYYFYFTCDSHLNHDPDRNSGFENEEPR